MFKDKNFVPGMPVWVIQRDEDGVADEVAGYVFLAHVNNVVILSHYVNDYDFDNILEYHVQCTAEEYDTDLCVFPYNDCYSNREDCKTDFMAEVNG